MHVMFFIPARIQAHPLRTNIGPGSQERDDVCHPDIFRRPFRVIVAMHRGVTRGADAKLRAQFDAGGALSAVSRQLMRHSGYGV